MSKFEYKIGFSLKDFNQISGKEFDSGEAENLIPKIGFNYKKVVVEKVLKETIPFCMDGIYKNPSSMRIDAPEAFSCSSLISYLYTQAGVWMPSLSIDKYVFGIPISEEDLKFGDLIFSNTGKGIIRTETVEYKPGTQVPEGVDHVGMYLEENKVIHATKKHGKVVVETLDDFTNSSKIVGYRRVTLIEEERFVVIIPENRTDLRVKENLINEIIKKQKPSR